MTIKKVKVEDAAGMVLGHDITKIVPGEYKGPAFRKGHIIRPEDIPHLKDIGKDHIFLIELAQNHIHEDEAARRMARAVAGPNVLFDEPSEGRINLRAEVPGLLKVNRGAVKAVNCIEYAVLSTLHGDRVVAAGDMIAAVKVVPLVVGANTVAAVEKIGMEHPGILAVRPFNNINISVIITGNEVYYGRIQDKFAPVMAEKAGVYGANITDIVYRPDDKDVIAADIAEYVNQGTDVVIVTGGMSVDPDDVTPEAIISTGAQVVTYGTPVLPGAMFMLAYLDKTVIIGMPACGMYSANTVFDIVFPRIMAGERLNKNDFAALGYGGLCLKCPECRFPHCPFGKGGA